jgi:WD40 repeat protein
LLAVAGFHEVLLHKLDGSEILARLIGMSERIESVAFSPDGNRLAVAGGLPGRGGELQVWDVAIPTGASSDWRPTLQLSVPVTYDTIYGGRWSPDGKLIAVGAGDNVVRAFDAESGEQVLFQGAHTDWVLDTVFSVDGSHLVSVGRDMTARLTEVATERFIDNITSITPGALKGGIHAVARHPERDEIVIGGADGVPKVYRLFRQTERRIGDDANLIRRLAPLRGRVFAVAISADGRRIASGSSLDGTGQVAIDSYEFDTSLPEDIKKINAKVVTARSAEEKKRLEEYF